MACLAHLLLLLSLSGGGVRGFAAIRTPARVPLPPPVILVEEAETGFVDDKENLEEGETLLRAVKAFGLCGGGQEDAARRKDFLCAGALVQRPTYDATTHDIWVADSLEEDGLSPNLQVKGAMQVIDELLVVASGQFEAALKYEQSALAAQMLSGTNRVCSMGPWLDMTLAQYQQLAAANAAQEPVAINHWNQLLPSTQAA